jgi:short-subunit dehydrogenase
MRILVISATSVIARSCVEVWAASGSHEFVFLGRDAAKLATIAADLEIRFPGPTFLVEVLDVQAVGEIEAMVHKLGAAQIDQVLIAQGSLTDQTRAKADLVYLEAELELNAVSAALWLEAFAGVLERQGFGNLAAIGSVASDRGRAYNYSYAAGKALLDVYVEGLQQRFADSKVNVSLIQPGPTATPMTSTHSGKMASPHAVAKVIVAGLARGKRRIYAPSIWRYIMLIVKLIPWTIFKRLNF